MSSTTRTSTTSRLTTVARYGVVVVAWLFALGGVVQVFLAGLSVFDSPSYWEDHESTGHMFGLLTYVLPLLALAGRVGIRLGVMAVLVTVLFIVQIILAQQDNGTLAAFHAVNALILIALAGSLGGQTLRLLRSAD